VPKASGRRRRAIVVLLVLLAVAPALALLPFDPASVRLAGVSVFWWYSAVGAPCLAIVVAALALLRSS
jgi:hypothetical protein